MEEKSVDIATADERGNLHHYNTIHTGVTVSPAYGLQYVDPTPVSTHVINADALEGMSTLNIGLL